MGGGACAVLWAGYRSARAVLQRVQMGVFSGVLARGGRLTVRKRTILVVVCGLGGVRYMFFVAGHGWHGLIGVRSRLFSSLSRSEFTGAAFDENLRLADEFLHEAVACVFLVVLGI